LTEWKREEDDEAEGCSVGSDWFPLSHGALLTMAAPERACSDWRGRGQIPRSKRRIGGVGSRGNAARLVLAAVAATFSTRLVCDASFVDNVQNSRSRAPSLHGSATIYDAHHVDAGRGKCSKVWMKDPHGPRGVHSILPTTAEHVAEAGHVVAGPHESISVVSSVFDISSDDNTEIEAGFVAHALKILRGGSAQNEIRSPARNEYSPPRHMERSRGNTETPPPQNKMGRASPLPKTPTSTRPSRIKPLGNPTPHNKGGSNRRGV